MLPPMGCAFLTSPMRTLSLTLLLIWVAISFPLVNGTLMSNAGNCSSNEFWYEPIQACIPLGGEHLVPSVPPSGTACPRNGNWYWSNQLAVCLPTSPESDVSSSGSLSCPAHHTWDAVASKCIRTGYARRSTSSGCGSTEFWFSEKATCLPRRNSAPSSVRCPTGWYWSAQLNSCAPAYPSAIWSLACGKGTVWSHSTLTCQRVASPSQRALPGTPSRRPSPSMSARQSSRRHGLKSRAVDPMCPPGLDACPILKAGDWSDYECIDSKYDIQHCGGCSMDGRGEDCTSIKGVWNVECSQARCSVLGCRMGYIPSADQRICIKL